MMPRSVNGPTQSKGKMIQGVFYGNNRYGRGGLYSI